MTKTLSVAAGMLGLAAIGTVSSLHDARGGSELPSHTASLGVSSAEHASVLQAAQALFAGSPSPQSPPDYAQARSIETPRGAGGGASTLSGTTTAASAPVVGAPLGSTPVGSSSAPGSAPSPSGITPDGKVILNTANAEQLDRLPGVGKKTAERIIELRTRLGRFRKVQDLLRVKGIGTKSLQKLAPLVVLDPA